MNAESNNSMPVPSAQKPTPTTHKFRAVAAGGNRAGAGSSYLLVFDQSTWNIFQLPSTGEVIIGRSEEADVVVSDVSVSRSHAKLLMTRGEAQVVDLGSRNGTSVNEQRITGPRKLEPGDVIGVCSVTLAFHSSGRPDLYRPILDLEVFRQRAEEELERSLYYQRPLTVLTIDLGLQPTSRAEVATALSGQLRLMDAVAWDGASQLLILLPETDADRAPSEAERIRQSLASLGPNTVVSQATCPVDGCDLVTLLASTHGHDAGRPGPAQLSSQSNTVQLRDQTIVVRDPAMIRLYALLDRLAAANLPILVIGETGTGKEIAALAIHEWSPRRDKPFVSLNCAALQENLVESELFGYERGAFSGAVGSKPGLLETAAGGTVLLDEIGELSLQAQAKLLRVLETKTMTRLGGVHERQIDIRVVAATNRDLRKEVREGRFRQDLFFRLSGATVVVPPLRERPADLVLLAQTMLDEACATAKRSRLTLSASALKTLAEYSWPGNVRELKHMMQYLAATVPSSVIQDTHLSLDVRRAYTEVEAIPETSGLVPQTSLQTTPPPAFLEPAAKHFRSVQEEVDALIKSRMAAALGATRGNRTHAASLIGMPLRTFVAKLKQYGLGKSDDRDDGE